MCTSDKKENLELKIYFITKYDIDDLGNPCVMHLGKSKSLSCSAYTKKGGNPWGDLMVYYIHNSIITDNSKLLNDREFIRTALDYKLEKEKIEELIKHENVSDEEIEEMFDAIQGISRD